MKKLRWGLLATGGIAKAFAAGVRHSHTGVLAAAGSRDLAKAEAFAAEFEIPRAHGSYEALLADPGVDAVYISTPHPMHVEWIIKAAQASKHILCEKPLTLNHAEAMAAAAAAEKHGVLLMEAFMVRCHPFIGKLREIIESGTIGDVRMIRATFSFAAGYNPDGRLFSNALGGGGILDVGCYTTTLSRLIAGMALGLPFASPVKVSGAGSLLETGVDGWAAGTLEFEQGIIAQVACGVSLNQENAVHVFGSEGAIRIPECWIPAKTGGALRLFVKKNGGTEEEVVVETGEWLYALEADAFGRALAAGVLSVPEMPVDDTLDNMQTLDHWRAAIGLTYESEKPSNEAPTMSRLPLRKSSSAPMTYASMPGSDFCVSRLVMGCDNQRTMPHAAALFDEFFEAGGNAFDTAYIYAAGLQERLLGHWMRSRGVRTDVFLIGKGAHTPHCTPEAIVSQLDASLARLQSDCVDLYLMHRDDPDVPVGEFVDVLNAQYAAGRIKAFGGSNWSKERVIAANEYAASRGLRGFAALSNNFSLARMVSPVWAGCVAASEPATKAWLAETGFPLFAWSSQARGFFTDRAGEDKRSDAELVRCWYSAENFERRRRALALAGKKKTTPINIALAYVISQPFPVFALIGPRTISELHSSCAGLGVSLSPGELAWLDLESDEAP